MSTELARRIETLPIEDEPTGLALVRALEGSGSLSPTALTLTDPDLPFERYEALAFLFGAIKRSCSFWIGDLLNFGEGVYGERYAQAVELTGLKPETLMNYASVCRYVARSRRRDSLSFGHHSAVTSLEPDEQTRWLDACEANGWSRTELRDRLKEANAVEPPEQPSWSREEPEGGTTPPAPSEPLSGPPSASGDDPVVGAPLPPAPEDEPTLAGAVRRLVEAAHLADTHYLVPRAAFEAVAALVGEE